MRIVIAGGGTGGHLSPGIAVAQALRRLAPQVEVHMLCSKRVLDAHMLSRAGLPYHPLNCESVPYGLSLRAALSAGRLAAATVQAGRLLKQLRPSVVLGVGGYVSAPVVTAARGRRIPVALHVLDAYPDRANLLLSRWAQWITVAFAAAAPCFPADRTEVVGCPVREEILRASRRTGQNELGLDPGLATLLVMGGSHGARRLNQAVVEALPRLLTSLPVQIVHLIGEAEFAEVTSAAAPTARVHGRYRPLAFTDEIGPVLAAADLAMARAGASSMAEMSVRGLAQILVPYPYAGGHQQANAAALVAAGGAQVLPDAHCDADRLYSAVAELVQDPGRRARMGETARAWAAPQAAERLAAGLLDRAE